MYTILSPRASYLRKVNERYDKSVLDVDYKYKYPNNMKLKPGMKLHDLLVDEVNARATYAINTVSSRYEKWNSMDKILTSYVDLTAEEKEMQKEDPRLPTAIVFPHSYAVLEALLAYMTSALMTGTIWKYRGIGKGDYPKALMLQKVIENHSIRYKHLLALHTYLRDMLVYGFGMIAPGWNREIRNRLFSEGGQKYMEEVVVSGNSLTNMDVYRVLPDPNTPIQDVQDMEFVGWVESTNVSRLLKDEAVDPSLFNVKYLRHLTTATSTMAADAYGRKQQTNSPTRVTSDFLRPVDITKMYIDLIPRDYELSKKEDIETWLVWVAGDSVVLKAEPVYLVHNKKPVSVCAAETDGYSSCPLSRLEVSLGLQNLVDWLLNSHISNVRRAVNMSFVVNPWMVNVDDIVRPKTKGGGVIRLRKPAWHSSDVGRHIQQLQVSDVTRGHVADANFATQLMNQVSGADQSMMGMLRQGGPERLTGQEFRGTRMGTATRLEKLTRITYQQGFYDLALMLAFHTQQFMEETEYVELVGEEEKILANEYGLTGVSEVRPENILCEVDVIPTDGVIPGKGSPELMNKMMETMIQIPEVMQRFDMFKIFKYIMREAGASNVDDFERTNVQVQPNEMVENQVQQGNLVPMQEYLNAQAG